MVSSKGCTNAVLLIGIFLILLCLQIEKLRKLLNFKPIMTACAALCLQLVCANILVTIRLFCFFFNIYIYLYIYIILIFKVSLLQGCHRTWKTWNLVIWPGKPGKPKRNFLDKEKGIFMIWNYFNKMKG